MKKIIFLAAIFSVASSFSQNKDSTKESNQKQSLAQMHEQIAKVHQQAADCLKSGKSEDECQKMFHEMCKQGPNAGECGPWMMHHMHRKGQSL